MGPQREGEAPLLLSDQQPSNFWEKLVQGCCNPGEDREQQAEVAQAAIQSRELLLVLDLEESDKDSETTTRKSRELDIAKDVDVATKKKKQHRSRNFIFLSCCLGVVVLFFLLRTNILKGDDGGIDLKEALPTNLVANVDMASSKAVFNSTWTSAKKNANDTWTWMVQNSNIAILPTGLSSTTWTMIRNTTTALSQSTNRMVVVPVQSLVSSNATRMLTNYTTDHLVSYAKDSSTQAKKKMAQMSKTAKGHLVTALSNSTASTAAVVISTKTRVVNNLIWAKEQTYSAISNSSKDGLVAYAQDSSVQARKKVVQMSNTAMDNSISLKNRMVELSKKASDKVAASVSDSTASTTAMVASAVNATKTSVTNNLQWATEKTYSTVSNFSTDRLVTHARDGSVHAKNRIVLLSNTVMDLAVALRDKMVEMFIMARDELTASVSRFTASTTAVLASTANSTKSRITNNLQWVQEQDYPNYLVTYAKDSSSHSKNNVVQMSNTARDSTVSLKNRVVQASTTAKDSIVSSLSSTTASTSAVVASALNSTKCGVAYFAGSQQAANVIGGLEFPSSLNNDASIALAGGGRFGSTYSVAVYSKPKGVKNLLKHEKEDERFYTKFIASRSLPKGIILKFNRKVKSTVLENALLQSMKQQLQLMTTRRKEIEQSYRKFQEVLSLVLPSQSFVKGNEMSIGCNRKSLLANMVTFTSPQGTHSIRDKNICNAFFGIYLGDQANAGAVRQGFLSGIKSSE